MIGMIIGTWVISSLIFSVIQSNSRDERARQRALEYDTLKVYCKSDGNNYDVYTNRKVDIVADNETCTICVIDSKTCKVLRSVPMKCPDEKIVRRNKLFEEYQQNPPDDVIAIEWNSRINSYIDNSVFNSIRDYSTYRDIRDTERMYYKKRTDFGDFFCPIKHDKGIILEKRNKKQVRHYDYDLGGFGRKINYSFNNNKTVEEYIDMENIHWFYYGRTAWEQMAEHISKVENLTNDAAKRYISHMSDQNCKHYINGL